MDEGRSGQFDEPQPAAPLGKIRSGQEREERVQKPRKEQGEFGRRRRNCKRLVRHAAGNRFQPANLERGDAKRDRRLSIWKRKRERGAI